MTNERWLYPMTILMNNFPILVEIIPSEKSILQGLKKQLNLDLTAKMKDFSNRKKVVKEDGVYKMELTDAYDFIREIAFSVKSSEYNIIVFMDGGVWPDRLLKWNHQKMDWDSWNG